MESKYASGESSTLVMSRVLVAVGSVDAEVGDAHLLRLGAGGGHRHGRRDWYWCWCHLGIDGLMAVATAAAMLGLGLAAVVVNVWAGGSCCGRRR